MKIGDKVRFLNAVGGGVVTGFQGRDIAIVRDEDGFEVPTLAKECVVIETDNYNIAKKTVSAPTPSAEEVEPADRPITFKAKPVERRGADVMNLFLGFVPVNPKELSDTAFEAYLVNDSNYYVRFLILSQEGAACSVRHEGVAEPNTKIFLEEFRRDVLGELERLTVQTMAYKLDKPFLLKPALSISLRIDGTRFYKLHTFHPNDFFAEPALTVDIVRDDRPVRAAFVDADTLCEAITGKERGARNAVQPARLAKKQDKNAIIEVDLHASALLETTAGLQPKDILDYQLQVFRETMDERLREKGRRIVFIHGKGDGVLRAALLKELKAKYKSCSTQDASFREYGFGATMVTIR